MANGGAGAGIGINPNLLSSPIEQASPESLANLRDYANALMNPLNREGQLKEVHHPLQGLAHVLQAYVGRRTLDRTDTQLARQRQHQFNPSGGIVADRTTTGSITPPIFGERQTTTRTAGGVPLSTIGAQSGANFHINANYRDRFEGLIKDLETSGYQIDANQSGGYSNRNIRGSNRPSMHASGDAIDVNWIRNARGTQGDIDLALARQLAAKHGFRWGGDFGVGTRRHNIVRDPMHFEIDKNWQPQTALPPVANRAMTGIPQQTNTPPQTNIPPSNRNVDQLMPPALAANQLPSTNANPPFGAPSPIDLTGRSNLGGPGSSADVGATTPNQGGTQVAQAAPPGAPGAPPGAATQGPQGMQFPQMPVDPRIQNLEHQLRNAHMFSQEDATKIFSQYNELIAPKEVDLGVGTAQYDPRSGVVDPRSFRPKLITGQISAGGVGVPEYRMFNPNTNNLGILDTPPTDTTSGFGQGGATSNPPISPRTPPFPRGSGISQMSDWAANQAAQGSIANTLAGAQAGVVTKAIEAGEAAPAQISSLNALDAASRVGGGFRGTAAAPFFLEVKKFLSNFGFTQEQLSGLPAQELLEKLNTILASENTRNITSRGTNFEFQTFMRANPAIFQSEQGFYTLVDLLRQQRQHDQSLGELAQTMRPDQLASWNEMKKQYYRENPLIINIRERQGRNRVIPEERIYAFNPRNQEEFDRVPNNAGFIGQKGNILRRQGGGSIPWEFTR